MDILLIKPSLQRVFAALVLVIVLGCSSAQIGNGTVQRSQDPLVEISHWRGGLEHCPNPIYAFFRPSSRPMKQWTIRIYANGAAERSTESTPLPESLPTLAPDDLKSLDDLVQELSRWSNAYPYGRDPVATDTPRVTITTFPGRAQYVFSCDFCGEGIPEPRPAFELWSRLLRLYPPPRITCRSW